MRRAILLVFVAGAGLAVPALAQPSEIDADAFVPMLGLPWSEAKVHVAVPDSGRVVGKTGTLLWRSPARELSALRLRVQDGVLAEVTAVAAARAYDDFERIVGEAREALGPPGADGFYTADQVQAFGRLGDVRVELRFDMGARSMTLRAPPQR